MSERTGARLEFAWPAVWGLFNLLAAAGIWIWLHMLSALGRMEAVSKFRVLTHGDVVDEEALSELARQHPEWTRGGSYLVEHGYSHVRLAAWVIATLLLANAVIFLLGAYTRRQRWRLPDLEDESPEA